MNIAEDRLKRKSSGLNKLKKKFKEETSDQEQAMSPTRKEESLQSE